MKEKRPARKNAYRTLCAAAGGAAGLRLGGWWADWTARSASASMPISRPILRAESAARAAAKRRFILPRAGSPSARWGRRAHFRLPPGPRNGTSGDGRQRADVVHQPLPSQPQRGRGASARLLPRLRHRGALRRRRRRASHPSASRWKTPPRRLQCSARYDDAIPPGASGGIFLNIECAFGAN